MFDNRVINTIQQSFQKYFDQQIDVVGLAHNLNALVPALEGDVPSNIRELLLKIAVEIEIASYAESSEEQPLTVRLFFDELSEAIKVAS